LEDLSFYSTARAATRGTPRGRIGTSTPWRLCVRGMARDEASRAEYARGAARDAHRSFREPHVPTAPTDAATRVAEAARAAQPLLDMKQRTTRDDPDGFMDTFFRASRLHYIGTWKHRYEAFLEDLPMPPPLPGGANAFGKGRSERVVMHVDMDCFFAAVAMLGRPELADLPVAVSWSSGTNGAGELSSCNYKAREFGCRAGGRVSDALKKCPNLVVMPYEFEKYSQVAIQVYEILHATTPHVMGVSVDEAYIDVTSLIDAIEVSDPSRGEKSSAWRLKKKKAHDFAQNIRDLIRTKTGCVASVGVGPNRLIARLATKRAKPDGVFVVTEEEAKEYVASLPVTDLPGVGRGALEKLKKTGVFPRTGAGAPTPTCREIVMVSMEKLKHALGPKSSVALRDACLGIDARVWVSRPPRKSVGAQVTWGVRFDEASEVVAFCEKLVGEVSARAKKLGVKGKCVTLKVLRAVANVPEGKYVKGNVGHGVCDHLTRSVTLSAGFTADADALAAEANAVLAKLAIPADEIRGLGVQLSKLDSDPESLRWHSSGARGGLRTAPAGPRTEWADRDEAMERRYTGWFVPTSREPLETNETSTSKARGFPAAKATAYAAAIDNARGGGLVAALARGTKRRPRSDFLERDDFLEAEAQAMERRRNRSDDAAFSNDAPPETDPPPALRRAHAAAARAHAYGARVFSNRQGLEEENAVARARSASILLAECESFVLRRAREALETAGRDRAAAVVDAARRLARAQWTTPPEAFSLCGEFGARAAAQQRSFADAWIAACDRVAEELARGALTR